MNSNDRDQEARKMLDFIIRNFNSIKWKKEKCYTTLYDYTATVDGIDVEIQAFSCQGYNLGYYVRFDVRYANVEFSLTTEDNLCGRNSELFRLESMLGEGNNYKSKEVDFINKIKRLTDMDSETPTTRRII